MHIRNFLHLYGIPSILIVVFSIIFGLLFVDASRFTHSKISRGRISPYVLCTEGQTIVSATDNSSKTLEKDDKSELQPGQRIHTNRASSASIFWADGSVSRLSEETEIVVNELKTVSSGSTKADISINSGKSWTNTSRILDPDSEFKVRYESGTRVAAVRGTIFEVNIDDGYIFTESHAVEVFDEKGGLKASLPEGTGLQIPSNSDNKELIIQSRKITDWVLSNNRLDTVITQERIEKLQKALELAQNSSTLQQMQNWLRELIGMKRQGANIAITTTENGVELTLNSEAITKDDAEKLRAVFEILSGVNTQKSTSISKQSIQELLVKIDPENTASYAAQFARSELYDSWGLLRNADTRDKEVQKQIKNLRDRASDHLAILENSEKGNTSGRTSREMFEDFERSLPTNYKKLLEEIGIESFDAIGDAAKSAGDTVNKTNNAVIDAGITATEVIGEGINNTAKDTVNSLFGQ